MSNASSRSLTNSFQDVRLVSLASWSKAAEIQPRDHGGPYVVIQAGYDPQDYTLAEDEFVLGRSGQWLSLGLFYRLPVPERRAEFIFGTAAEVMQTLGSLPSKPRIARPGEKAPPTEAAPADDEMAQAIRADSGRGSGAKPS